MRRPSPNEIHARSLPQASMTHPIYSAGRVYIHRWDGDTVCVSAEPWPAQTFWVSRKYLRPDDPPPEGVDTSGFSGSVDTPVLSER